MKKNLSDTNVHLSIFLKASYTPHNGKIKKYKNNEYFSIQQTLDITNYFRFLFKVSYIIVTCLSVSCDNVISRVYWSLYWSSQRYSTLVVLPLLYQAILTKMILRQGPIRISNSFSFGSNLINKLIKIINLNRLLAMISIVISIHYKHMKK